MQKMSKQREKGYIDSSVRFFFLNDRSNRVVDYHYHTFSKCVIVYGGKVEYTVEGRTFELGAGDVLWVPEFMVHQVKIDDAKHYKRCVVYLAPEFIKSMGEKICNQIKERVDNGNFLINTGSVERRRDVFSYDAVDKDNVERIIEFLKFIKENFDGEEDLKEPVESPKESSFDKLVFSEQVKEYIVSDLNRDLSVHGLSDVFFLSKHYFMKKFKEETGLGVHEFIVSERVKLSRELMKENNNLTEIAYKVGFNNYSTFARSFKKVYGISPREFKKLAPVGYDKE